LLVAQCHFLKIKSQDLCGVVQGQLTNSGEKRWETNKAGLDCPRL